MCNSRVGRVRHPRPDGNWNNLAEAELAHHPVHRVVLDEHVENELFFCVRQYARSRQHSEDSPPRSTVLRLLIRVRIPTHIISGEAVQLLHECSYTRVTACVHIVPTSQNSGYKG